MATEERVLEHDVHHDNAQGSWDGASEPFKASYGKLMMWYFLLSDAFTFSGFLIAYGALRFSSATWPVPDFVFQTAPFNNLGLGHDTHLPLIFVTFMSFLLILSSVTMVRAVQEGHRENKNGVVFWMLLTILGGIGFLGCQAWEWNNLMNAESMTALTNPFGTHPEDGEYLTDEYGYPYKGGEKETFKAGQGYLVHTKEHIDHQDSHGHGAHGGDAHGDSHGHHEVASKVNPAAVNEGGFVIREVAYASGIKQTDGSNMKAEMGPKAFGALFFGLYWHFVDLVWVFVFLVFYLL